MKRNKLFTQMVILTLMGAIVFGLPSVALAQETDPPMEEPSGLDDTPENDLVVFEPQFFWELPLSQGFKISFNFGISFEMPRELTLLSEEAFNFFLHFRTFVREDALELTETPEPDQSPTP
ncbi:MAG: hypothetical protein ACOCYU_05490 [Brevefilum sp.]